MNNPCSECALNFLNIKMQTDCIQVWHSTLPTQTHAHNLNLKLFNVSDFPFSRRNRVAYVHEHDWPRTRFLSVCTLFTEVTLMLTAAYHRFIAQWNWMLLLCTHLRPVRWLVGMSAHSFSILFSDLEVLRERSSAARILRKYSKTKMHSFESLRFFQTVPFVHESTTSFCWMWHIHTPHQNENTRMKSQNEKVLRLLHNCQMWVDEVSCKYKSGIPESLSPENKVEKKNE